MKKQLVFLWVIPALAIALVGYSALVPVQPAQAYTLCATTTWKTVSSASTSVSGGTLSAYVQGAFDGHFPSTYCGGLRGKGTITKPSGGGGTLNITLNAGVTLTGSASVPEGNTSISAYTGISYSSDCGNAVVTFAGALVNAPNRCAA